MNDKATPVFASLLFFVLFFSVVTCRVEINTRNAPAAAAAVRAAFASGLADPVLTHTVGLPGRNIFSKLPEIRISSFYGELMPGTAFVMNLGGINQGNRMGIVIGTAEAAMPTPIGHGGSQVYIDLSNVIVILTEPDINYAIDNQFLSLMRAYEPNALSTSWISFILKVPNDAWLGDMALWIQAFAVTPTGEFYTSEALCVK